MLWLYILDWCCLYRWIFSVFSKNCPPKYIYVSISNFLWMCMCPCQTLTYRVFHTYVYIYILCMCTEQHKHTAHFKTYQTVRVTKLKAELKEVEQSNPTSWTHLLQDGPYEKGKYPFREFFTLTFHLLRRLGFSNWSMNHIFWKRVAINCFISSIIYITFISLY